MPGPARIDQGDLEANFPPQHVRRIFCDDGSGNPGPRLAKACLRASRRAEAILLRAWTLEQIDVLFAEDDSIVAESCRLAIAFGVDGKTEWSGQGAPYQGAEKAALAALRDLTDAETRSRAESLGAGTNPTIKGSIGTPREPAYVFANSINQTRRGGY